MARSRCCVIGCFENGSHSIPKDEKRRKLWLIAIRRENLKPKVHRPRICAKHFTEDDYQKISYYTGLVNERRVLKRTAVPTVFPWNKKDLSKQAIVKEEELLQDYKKKLVQDVLSTLQSSGEAVSVQEQKSSDNLNVCHYLENNVSETIASNENSDIECQTKMKCCTVNMSKSITSNINGDLEDTTKLKTYTRGTQTSPSIRLFSTNILLSDNESIHFYTGLETYDKFIVVLSILEPMTNDIKYRYGKIMSVSVKDQFLIMLVKFKRNYPDFEIGKMFGVSDTEVANIVVSWIHFASDIWSLSDIWPGREIAKSYMCEVFKNKLMSSKVNTKLNELSLLKPSDQDLFYSHYEHLHGSLLKGKLHSLCQRTNIERLIGLTKRYKIITNKQNHYYLHLSEKIFHICLILCNIIEEIHKEHK